MTKGLLWRVVFFCQKICLIERSIFDEIFDFIQIFDRVFNKKFDF